ncbi:STAS domain-containing protein [Devosia aquimaris]|uniref:STAS domain-containing protein n=1 Tax=Devosia aquimaris TaxID=2866214 RepID=UPI001CD137C5|nr:STAS domain-containing protein [Devosia sp. CJK-A8-3]
MTDGSAFVVTLSGEAGLRAAQEIAETLRKALATHQSIAIATQAITGADITTIQLLLAARKLALASGKSIALAGSPAGPLREALIALGCIDAQGRPLSDDGDFWAPSSHPNQGKAA